MTAKRRQLAILVIFMAGVLTGRFTNLNLILIVPVFFGWAMAYEFKKFEFNSRKERANELRSWDIRNV